MNEELFDVLDDFGNKTGEVQPKSVVHDRELRHGGAHLWIYNSIGEILLQLRGPETKLFPNRWDVSVAGHISAGDDGITTAVRESQEELGLKVDPKKFEFIGITSATPSIPAGGKLHRVFDYNYLVQMEVDVSTLTFEPGKVADVRWKPIDEMQGEIMKDDYLTTYSQRDRYIYLLPLAEIRKRTTDIGSVS